jgi:hypothetical protein
VKNCERFPHHQAGHAGAKVVQYNIDLWKDAEIEAAFKLIRTGPTLNSGATM